MEYKTSNSLPLALFICVNQRSIPLKSLKCFMSETHLLFLFRKCVYCGKWRVICERFGSREKCSCYKRSERMTRMSEVVEGAAVTTR
jgi:hypothetical protein